MTALGQFRKSPPAVKRVVDGAHRQIEGVPVEHDQLRAQLPDLVGKAAYQLGLGPMGEKQLKKFRRDSSNIRGRLINRSRV
jgi:hypothetical protein